MPVSAQKLTGRRCSFLNLSSWMEDVMRIPPEKFCKLGVHVVESHANAKGSISGEKGTYSSISKCIEAVNYVRPASTKRNFVHADPSYLKTLSQAQSSWIFGAIAELVDNSRDAKASRLHIAVEASHDKTSACKIPMLSINDNGRGMNHYEILRMVSYGDKQPDEENSYRIGRLGVGFNVVYHPYVSSHSIL